MSRLKDIKITKGELFEKWLDAEETIELLISAIWGQEKIKVHGDMVRLSLERAEKLNYKDQQYPDPE